MTINEARSPRWRDVPTLLLALVIELRALRANYVATNTRYPKGGRVK